MEYNYTKERGGFLVKERVTGYTVRVFSDINETKKFVKRLNSGHGFNGWTPNFFLVEGIK